MAEGVGGFLGALNSRDAAALRELGWRRRFPRGSTLFLEGERSDRVLVITTGRLKLSTHGVDGREALLAIAGPGDLLGELSALDGEPRSASAIALEPVEALVITCDDFLGFLEEHPSAALVLMRMLTWRLRDTDRKRVEFGAYDTVGRIARRLLELSERFGEPVDGGIRITVPLSQEELAGWVGSSREAVVKALRALRDRGWVETKRREIRLVDVDALKHRAT